MCYRRGFKQLQLQHGPLPVLHCTHPLPVPLATSEGKEQFEFHNTIPVEAGAWTWLILDETRTVSSMACPLCNGITAFLASHLVHVISVGNARIEGPAADTNMDANPIQSPRSCEHHLTHFKLRRKPASNHIIHLFDIACTLIGITQNFGRFLTVHFLGGTKSGHSPGAVFYPSM